MVTGEDKELLLKDLCARLPYGFVIHRKSDNSGIKINDIDEFAHFLEYSDGEEFKPYLRPMSSMTEEERKELSSRYVWKIDICGQIQIRYHSEGYWDDDTDCPTEEYLKLFDWLNKLHFDYRGLIPKGLALEVPEGMYNEKEK